MARSKGSRKPPGQKKPPLTHFLCLPLVNAVSGVQLAQSLKKFKDETVSSIDTKAIRPVGALHCTLGVMSLSKKELDAATQTLQDLDILSLLRELGSQSLVSTRSIGSESAQLDSNVDASNKGIEPLSIDLKGLESMHESQQTSMLYIAPHDTTDRLRPLCLSLQRIFQDEGLLVEDGRPLKLHATIVNTIYAKSRLPKRPAQSQIARASGPVQVNPRSESSPQMKDHRPGIDATEEDAPHNESQGPVGTSSHGPNARGSLKFDARDLLDRYKNFVWADNFVIDRIAICEMGAKKKFDGEGRLIGEEYTEVVSLSLPS